MQKKMFCFISFILVCQIYGQTDTFHSAIIYGNDNSFVVRSPDGWILDTKSGVTVGLTAVFYKEGSTWKDAVSVMYCNTVSKKSKGNETLKEVIDNDVKNFTKDNKAEVEDADSLITSDNKTAVVKKFFDKLYNNYESVGYIDEKNVVIMIVLSSRNKTDFEQSYLAFKALVTSYYYLTDNVRVKDK